MANRPLSESERQAVERVIGPLGQVRVLLSDTIDAAPALRSTLEPQGVRAYAVCFGCCYPVTPGIPPQAAGMGPGAIELRRAAVSYPGLILLDDEMFEPGTASGLALLAHEKHHQEQMQRDPFGFGPNYEFWVQRTENLKLRPWRNPYEWPAYVREAETYRDLVAQGMPPGRRPPLLVSEGTRSQRGPRAIVLV